MRCPWMFLLLVAGCTTAGPARYADPEAFTAAWRIVDETRPDLDAAAWERVLRDLRDDARAAEDPAELRAVIRAMLDRLGDDRYAVLPPDEDPPEPPTSAESAATPGLPPLRVGRVGGRVLVTEVLGDVPDPRIVPGVEVIGGRVAGPIGEPAELTFETVGGERFAATLSRREPPGEVVRVGKLPPVRVELRQRTVETVAGPVVVAKIGAVAGPRQLTDFLAAAIDHAHETGAAGFALDLRGNPGGITALAAGLAGYFVDAPGQTLGTLTLDGVPLELRINPRRPAWAGPLAVLVDGGTLGAAEVLAAGLADSGRARLFGGRTGGAAAPAAAFDLPGGDTLLVPAGTYTTPGGTRVGRAGVEPGLTITPDRRSVAEGRDPVLEAAAAWIVGRDRRDRRANPQRRLSA